MRYTRKNRKRKRKSRRGGLGEGWFGPSASDKYADGIIANLNNGKLEDILKKLTNNLEESIIPKLKQKAPDQNLEYVTHRIRDIITEREAARKQ